MMINQVVKTKNGRIYLILDKINKGTFDYYLSMDLENQQIARIESDHILEIGNYKGGIFNNMAEELINNLKN